MNTLERLERANPVADADRLLSAPSAMDDFVLAVKQRSGFVQTTDDQAPIEVPETQVLEIDQQKPIFQKDRRRGWVYGLAAAVITLIFVGVAWALLSNDSEPDVAPQPAPTPTIVDTTPSTVPESVGPLPTYLEFLTADGRFTTFLELMNSAGQRTLLIEAGQRTIFVPTDDAFAALPEGFLDELKAKPFGDGDFFSVMVSHAAQEDFTTDELKSLSSIDTLIAGRTINVEVDADGAVVLNGVAKIIDPDLVLRNGTAHVIDAVLIPTSNLEEVLAADGRFTTYLELWDIVAIDGSQPIGNVLSQEATLTLFVPTDEAFAALPEGVLDDLKTATDLRLQGLLGYLSLPVRVDSLDLESRGRSIAVNGGTALVTNQDSVFRLTVGVDANDNTVIGGNGGPNAEVIPGEVATIIEADIEASNGIIHVIDTVLIPPDPEGWAGE